MEVDTDSRLQLLSDTEILLNFRRAMDALYPSMKAVYAHCYDPYDDIVEPLFWGLVYSSFSGKYGVPLPPQVCHTYDSVGDDYTKVSYVRVRPFYLPIEGRRFDEPFQVTTETIAGRELIFKTFGDGVHALTSGEDESDPYDVSFHMTEIEAAHLDRPSRPGEAVLTFWVPNEAVEYEFVPNGSEEKA